jgi:hypothetical protein
MASSHNSFLNCPKDNKLALVASCVRCDHLINISWIGETGDKAKVKCEMPAGIVTLLAESKNDSRGLANLISMSRM